MYAAINQRAPAPVGERHGGLFCLEIENFAARPGPFYKLLSSHSAAVTRRL